VPLEHLKTGQILSLDAGEGFVEVIEA
jgi:hypothetical protein